MLHIIASRISLATADPVELGEGGVIEYVDE